MAEEEPAGRIVRLPKRRSYQLRRLTTGGESRPWIVHLRSARGAACSPGPTGPIPRGTLFEVPSDVDHHC
jgi:hypothetical protein